MGLLTFSNDYAPLIKNSIFPLHWNSQRNFASTFVFSVTKHSNAKFSHENSILFCFVCHAKRKVAI